MTDNKKENEVAAVAEAPVETAAASSLPTSAACSVFEPLKVFLSSPWPAAASVLRSTSSTSCALMPRFERKTTRRGRSAEPRTLWRTRLWRRRRACLTVNAAT